MKRFCDQRDNRFQASRSNKARGFDHRGTQILPCPEVLSNLSKLSLKISSYLYNVMILVALNWGELEGK